MFLVKVAEFKIKKNVNGHRTPRTHTKRYAATSPQLTFYIFFNFKFSDFNKEPTNSLKMI